MADREAELKARDAQARQRALHPGGSFAVTAPAGSGKTELLTQRVLGLLATVNQPEEILAITFTRKAAHEMRHRIIAALQSAQIPAAAPAAPHETTRLALARAVLERDATLEWQLLRNPHRLRIQTIDSFAMSLVQSMPLTAGIGTQAAIEEEAAPLYRRAVRQLLEELGHQSAVCTDLELLLGHLDNNAERLEQLLVTVLGRREQWLRHLAGARGDLSGLKSYLENSVRGLICETLQTARALFAPYAPELVAKAGYAAANLALEQKQTPLCRWAELDALPAADAQALPQWRGLTDLLLTAQGEWRKRLTKEEGFPSGTREPEKSHNKAAKAQMQSLMEQLQALPGALNCLQEIRALPEAEFAPQQWQMLGVLSRLLPILVAQLMLAFRQQGQVDYPQITSAALTALGQDEAPTELALRLDYQIRHILIDEFQDTSSAQFEMLARLIGPWLPGDGRTLFIVGDGMQSCYGFRDANVGLLLRARKYGIASTALENLDLSNNFRSRPAIVAWVNATFQTAFPSQEDLARGAVCYSPSRAVKAEPDPTAAAAVNFFACVEQGSRQTEANQVVRLVAQHLAADAHSSIAILVRTRTHLAAIIPALRQAGIDWSSLDIDALAQRPAIFDLISLTRALLNPADRLSWLALLRAPWAGLSLADLHALSAHQDAGRHPSLWHCLQDPARQARLSSAGQIIVQRLLRQLEPALAQRQRLPLARWIEAIWLSLGGPSQAYAAQDLEQAPVVFALLQQLDRGGEIDLDELQRQVERLYAAPRTQAGGLARVRIMTIHKAKGLEFDHVILPGLDRPDRSDEHALLLWHERLAASGEAHLLISPIAAKGANRDPLYQYIRREQKIKNRLENTRLIYVAATRAITSLSLLATLRENAEGDWLAPAENSLLAPVWPALARQAQRLDAASDTASITLPGAAKPTSSLLRRLAPDWVSPLTTADPEVNPSGPEQAAPGRDVAARQLASAGQAIDWARTSGADTATLAGYYFRRLLPALLRPDVTSSPELMRLAARFIGQDHPPRLTARLLANLEVAIANFSADTQGPWRRAQAQSYRINWNLAYRIDPDNAEAQPASLAIPLAFIADGHYWLLDFDLSDWLGGDHPQTQIASLTGRKQSYFALAARAARALVDQPVQAALYLPHARHLEVIDSL